ncbi:MAG TPA: pilus assembly protein PilZ [Pseudomonas xinjiangensis]|uniref:Pilus assembly protein PilZ n=2 Tax=root TaxID=1 RepID=A0A7V1BQV2_9GAMM|nr:pilus assembly protein PilZ [Halopseudomonas xinjiangensis]HEC46218.1 pilus assembly protein PilZ [Halopseudomonas xinjiangensis]
MSILFEQETGPQPPREIRSQIEINALLKSLQQSRDQLIITFSGRTQKFQSFIVHLNTGSGQYWIDELIPRDGDRYASQGEAFRVDAWRDGVHMRWHCPAAQKVLLEDAPAYCIPLPQDMTYHQKRGAYRANVHRTLETGVGITHDRRSLDFRGHLLDISATGCKGRLTGDHSGELQPGEIFESSYLELPDAGRFSVAMEIRHAVYERQTDETHVGLKFKLPSPTAQRQIDRFVNSLQREARRLEKEDLF